MLGIAVSLSLLGWYAEHLTYTALAAIVLPTSALVGMFQAANNTSLVAAIPAEAKGFGSGMLDAARQFGHGSAVPAISAIMALSVVPGLRPD
jgi:hypothetical protein